MLGFLFEGFLWGVAFHVVASMDSDLAVGALCGERAQVLGELLPVGLRDHGGQQQTQAYPGFVFQDTYVKWH